MTHQHDKTLKENVIQKNTKRIQEVYETSKKPIGSGGFGVVTKCKHKVTGQVRACKTVPRKNVLENLEQFEKEIEVLQKLDHPHILKLYEYFEDDKNFYLITEMCNGGDLFDKIIEMDGFTEDFCGPIFKQIL